MALVPLQLRHQAEVGADVYVYKLGCNSDCTALAAATSEHAIRIFDPASLQPVRSLEGHGDQVTDLSFFLSSPSCLASCSTDGSARLWDLRSPEASTSFTVSSQEVYSCSVGRGDAAIACAASEKVLLFDVVAGKRLRTYKDCHTDVVNHVRFHPAEGGTKLLSGAEDNLVVLLDTEESREEEAMLAVIPNDECVRSFTLVGPGRSTLCCASTTEDVRIFGLGLDDIGMKKAEFLGLRDHALLTRDESRGYIVETFYDEPSQQVTILAGAGIEGDLMLFRLSLAEPTPCGVFTLPAGAGPELTGHRDIVRSAVTLPSGAIVTAGEDGRVCAWREEASADAGGAEQLGLEPTAYGAQRTSGAAGRHAAPY